MTNSRVSPLLGKAIGFLQKGDLDSALFFVTSYMDICPDDADGYNLAGVVKLKQSLFDEAVVFLKKAIELKKDVSLYYVNLGNALVGTEEYEEAIESFQNALNLEPNLSAAMCSLGNVFSLKGDVDKGIDYFRKALAIKPDGEAFRGMSKILMDMDNLEEAFDAGKRAVEMLPNDAESWDNLGLVLLKLKEFSNAEEAFLQALKITPTLSGYWNNLAIVRKEQGKLEEAEEAIRKSIKIMPDNYVSLNNLGNILLSANKEEEAIDIYEKAIRIEPEKADVYNNLALLYRNRGDTEKSINFFEKALEKSPENISVLNNYAGVLRKAKQYKKAVSVFEKIIDKGDADAGIYNNYGLVCLDMKDRETAVKYFEKAINADEKLIQAYNNYGVLLYKMNDTDKAIEILEKAIKINPEYIDAWGNLGHAFYLRNEIDKSYNAYSHILDIDENNATALFSCGVIAWKKREYSKGLNLVRKAIKNDRDRTVYLNTLGVICNDLGLIKEAREAYEKLIEIAKEPVPLFHSNYLFCLHYDCTVSKEELFNSHIEWNRKNASIEIDKNRPHKNNRDENRKLKIGYVSGDFRGHSVNFFSFPIIKGHNRDKFEVYSYSNVQNEDRLTEENREATDFWRGITGLSTEEQVELVREDAIDILVDLSGHTSGNRLPLFACKPSPVQVTFIGYPDTTGLLAMDYRIVDEKTDTVGQADKLATEKLVRMPDSFLCYQPYETDVPDVSELPFNKNGFITFGSFNNISKLGNNVIKVWAGILKRVPNSRIVLKAKQLDDEEVRNRITGEFAECGISNERIECLSYAENLFEHLSLYSKIDICLDTFPYNGTTTTCEAMWLGVPVVGMEGDSHAARVTKSLLTTVGLEDYIADSEKDYIEKAVSKASNVKALSELRKKIRNMVASSPLCDRERYIKNLENIYRDMWKKWCVSEPTYEMLSVDAEEQDVLGAKTTSEVKTDKTLSTL